MHGKLLLKSCLHAFFITYTGENAFRQAYRKTMDSYVIERIISIIHSEIRLVGKDGHIRERFGNLPEKEDPFCTDPSFLHACLARPPLPLPDIFTEHTYIYYALLRLPGGTSLLAGPVQVIRGTHDPASWMAAKHAVPVPQLKLPYCDAGTFLNGILLLCHSLTGKEISINDLCVYHGFPEKDLAHKELNRLVFASQESEIPHNPYSHEARKLKSIEEGSLELLQKCQEEVWVGELGRVADTPLRQEKNIAIIVIVLASRAAIRGGLLPELAFSMADSFIIRTERMTDILQIRSASRQFEEEFAVSVHNLHKSISKNKYVDLAKEYVYRHLHSAISIGEISRYAGLNKDYLSLLFSRCEGITLQHYIRREKIRQAEYMLKYSDEKMDEIAAHLAFCSQSHFSHCFKEETGMTPSQYKNQFYKT